MLVDHVGEGGGEQATAAGDEAEQRSGVPDQVEAGRDHQVVAVERPVGPHHVDLDVELVERGVPALDLGEVVELGRMVALVDRPPGRPVQDDRDPRLAARRRQIAEVGQLGAEGRDLAVGPGLGAGVRQHRGVELLAAGGGLPPLEEQHPVGAAPDRLHAQRGHLAGRLGRVVGSPVDRVRRLLHQDPRRAGLQRPHQVAGERRLPERLRVARVGVAVVGDHVELGGPALVVAGRERADMKLVVIGWVAPASRMTCFSRRRMSSSASEEKRRKSSRPPGLTLAGVEPRRHDLLEVGVVLRPEPGAPGVVQGVDGVVVLRPQPGPERGRGLVGVVVDGVAAELVVDVPEHHRRDGPCTARRCAGPGRRPGGGSPARSAPSTGGCPASGSRPPGSARASPDTSWSPTAAWTPYRWPGRPRCRRRAACRSPGPASRSRRRPRRAGSAPRRRRRPSPW